MQGNRYELKIFLQICLITSQINQEFIEEERIHRFLKGNFHEKYGPFDPVKGRFDGHDCMMIVGHTCEVIVAMIHQQMSYYRAAIGPLSRSDQVTIARGS